MTGKKDTDNDGDDRDGDGLCDAGDPEPDEPNVVSPDKTDGGVTDIGSDAGVEATTNSDGGGIPNDGGDQYEDSDSSGCQCNAIGSSSFGLLHILMAFAWIAVVRRRAISERLRSKKPVV